MTRMDVHDGQRGKGSRKQGAFYHIHFSSTLALSLVNMFFFSVLFMFLLYHKSGFIITSFLFGIFISIIRYIVAIEMHIKRSECSIYSPVFFKHACTRPQPHWLPSLCPTIARPRTIRSRYHGNRPTNLSSRDMFWNWTMAMAVNSE